MGVSYNMFTYHYNHLRRRIGSDSSKLTHENHIRLRDIERYLEIHTKTIIEILDENYIQKEM